MSNNAYMITDVAATIFFEGNVYTVESGHPNWVEIYDALMDGDYLDAVALIDVASTIDEWGGDSIDVTDGVILYNGMAINNSLTRRIIRMISDGFDAQPLINFMGRLMQNPSSRAVQELYRFLECNNLPITEDGYFLAYKNVDSNYRDWHSGTFDNSIGSVCQMPRNAVMDDPNQTCSAGLHFCSIEYLSHFHPNSSHTMILKIDPADVVSIPVDYNNSKGRCSKYEVIAQHSDGSSVDTLSDHSVYVTARQDTAGKSAGYHNKRDAYGRFTKR